MAAPMTDWPKCYARRRRRYVGSRLYTHRLLLFFAAALKILREWEQGVILRLGKFQAMRGPGIMVHKGAECESRVQRPRYISAAQSPKYHYTTRLANVRAFRMMLSI